MKYSYNLDKKDVVFAGASDINASYKDLAAVCDAIRYKKADAAIALLDSVISDGMPIEYKKFNKGMGSRHELHGRKGRYPRKAASIVKKVVLNAYANAADRGYMPEDMYVVHAAANKTEINRRYPSKGVRTVMRGGYGYASTRMSNLEFAKVEIGLSSDYSKKSRKLSRVFNAVRIQEEKHSQRSLKTKSVQKPAQAKPGAKKPAKPLPVPKAAKQQEAPAEKSGEGKNGNAEHEENK